MLALSEMFPAGCRVQVLTCRRPLFQAASPPWLPAFSLAAWLALAPTRSPTIPVMFGSPSVGIYTFFFFPPANSVLVGLLLTTFLSYSHLRSADRRHGKEVLWIQEVHASWFDGWSEVFSRHVTALSVEEL